MSGFTFQATSLLERSSGWRWLLENPDIDQFIEWLAQQGECGLSAEATVSEHVTNALLAGASAGWTAYQSGFEDPWALKEWINEVIQLSTAITPEDGESVSDREVSLRIRLAAGDTALLAKLTYGGE